MRRTFTALALALAVSLVAVSFTSVTAWAELGPIPLDAETDWLFEDDAPDPADRDPFEPVNRGIFGFNEVVYGWVFEPVSVAYQWVIPGPGRRAVRRFFSNLGEPVTLVNDLLRFRPLQAGSSGARFLINTTAGVGGLFDPATAWGLEAHTSGFGGTLAVYRVPSGPYLVMPIMGPSTARRSHAPGYLAARRNSPVDHGGRRWLQHLRHRARAARRASNHFRRLLRRFAERLPVGSRRADRDSARRRIASHQGETIFSSSEEISDSKPSRLNTDEYSDRRRASSLTVPFMKTSMTRQLPSAPRSR